MYIHWFSERFKGMDHPPFLVYYFPTLSVGCHVVCKAEWEAKKGMGAKERERERVSDVE